MTTEIAKTEPAESNISMSERFTAKILQQFGNFTTGQFQVTEYQRKLIQGYFIKIDRSLKLAEDNRVRKNSNNKDPKYNNDLPFVWKNVNLDDLALDLMHYARMGLDMMQDNHLFSIPFKNNKTKQYDMTLMPGYNGIQYIAEKYALEKPVAVTTELVYDTDKFKPLKKNKDNKVESYEFEVDNPFNRGKIIGCFGYIEYKDQLKNKLIVMNVKDIEKRKPKKAAAEFWGGKKTEWESGKKIETETDGWYEEMCLKTIKREVYSAKNMPRDPAKIDESYHHMTLCETRIAQKNIDLEIIENANQELLEAPTILDKQPNQEETATEAFLKDTEDLDGLEF